MPIDEESAKRLIPDQRKWIVKIVGACEQPFRRIRYRSEDTFGLMALCYVSKQLDHARSLGRLLEDPPSRDASVIARSMLEGASYLQWGVLEKVDRAEQWLEFTAVEEWRRLRDADLIGLEVTPEERLSIEEAIKNHGDRFLTKDAKKKKNQRKSLPGNPYIPSWIGMSFGTVVEKTKSEDLRIIYSLMSHSVHWGPGSVRSYLIPKNGDTLEYRAISFPDAASAGGWGIICLLQTAGIAAEHFELDDLAALIRRFYADYDELHSSVVTNG